MTKNADKNMHIAGECLFSMMAIATLQIIRDGADHKTAILMIARATGRELGAMMGARGSDVEAIREAIEHGITEGMAKAAGSLSK